MSCKVQIASGLCDTETLLESMNELKEVFYEVRHLEKAKGFANVISFRIKDVNGIHRMEQEQEDGLYNLVYEDFYRVGNGQEEGNQILNALTNTYNEKVKTKPNVLRKIRAKKELEIMQKAKEHNYRVIRREEGEKIKLVLVK